MFPLLLLLFCTPCTAKLKHCWKPRVFSNYKKFKEALKKAAAALKLFNVSAEIKFANSNFACLQLGLAVCV